MGCIIGTFPSACAQEGGGAITPLAYAFHPTIWDIFDRSGKTNFAAAPPFSGSVSPDIQLLSSEARQATITATSSGRPERLTVRNCPIIGPVTGWTCLSALAATRPGPQAIQLLRMFLSASSARKNVE